MTLRFSNLLAKDLPPQVAEWRLLAIQGTGFFMWCSLPV